MPTSEELGERARSRLPAAALASLREAFADEVRERLPRLREAARTRDPELLEAARRDAHTLGSSAYVVDEPAAATLARAAEVVLVKGGDLDEFAALVADLDDLLSGWTA